MRFMIIRVTGYRPIREAEYTVQPKTIATDPQTHMPTGGQKRIYAEFKGNPPMFDSEEAQRRFGWTDDERLRVERHLLVHKDYGRGMFLGAGEVVPPEHEGYAPASAQAPTEVPRQLEAGICRFVTKEWPLEVCGADVVAGTDLCEQHFREVERAEAESDVPEEATV